MLFNSFEFLFVFFPIITIVYYLLPHTIRWLWLLIASCIFYMFFIPEYILILFTAIVIDYFAGIYIENTESVKKKKIFLTVSILSTCMILLVFKYYNFFIDNINALLHLQKGSGAFSALSLILPIGLSFHTFQSLSYVIEVYRGKQKSERHFGIYSLYVMFYPQLVAGPIERPQNVLYQFHKKIKFSYENLFMGLRLILWGLFKKVVIADSLSPVADKIFMNYGYYSSSYTSYIGALFFTIQIYCDFSGYSDIALGTSRVLGINLMENFKFPYISTSIKEFWSRWHISLSTWFRDYVYIPMGGSRISESRTIVNQVSVFMISGLWHGANLTFIFWGFLHSCYLVAEIFISKLTPLFKLPNLLKKVIIFHLVLLAWIFFRADTITIGSNYIYEMFRYPLNFSLGSLTNEISFGKVFIKILLVLFFLMIDRRISLYIREPDNLFSARAGILLNILLILLLLIGQWTHVSFIYFQF